MNKEAKNQYKLQLPIVNRVIAIILWVVYLGALVWSAAVMPGHNLNILSMIIITFCSIVLFIFCKKHIGTALVPSLLYIIFNIVNIIIQAIRIGEYVVNVESIAQVISILLMIVIVISCYRKANMIFVKILTIAFIIVSIISIIPDTINSINYCYKYLYKYELPFTIKHFFERAFPLYFLPTLSNIFNSLAWFFVFFGMSLKEIVPKEIVPTVTQCNENVLVTVKPIKPQEPQLYSTRDRFAYLLLAILLTIFTVIYMIIMIVIGWDGDWDFIVLSMSLPMLMVGWIAFSLWKFTANTRILNKYHASLLEYEQTMRLYEKQNPYYQEAEFYSLCKNKYNIVGKSTADIARMKMAAKELGFDWKENELCSRYDRGYKAETDQENAAQEKRERERVASILAQQENESKEVESRLHLTGTSKRIDLLNTAIAKTERDIQGVKDSRHKIMSLAANYQTAVSKESSDWAIVGGIVSGIAGPAAGVMAASQTYESEKAERQKKMAGAEQLNNAAIQTSLVLIEKENKIEDRLNTYRNNLEKAQILLSDDSLPQDKLLKVINPSITESSKLSLPDLSKISFMTQKGTVTIYDTVTAIVDGFFLAEVKLGNTLISRVYFELPIEGSNTPQKYSLYIPDSDPSRYTVTFKPANLFAVEIK